MTLKAKISSIIVIPIYSVLIICGLLLASIIYFTGFVFQFTGIGESFEIIGKKIKTIIVKSKFNQLRKKENIQ